MQKAIVVTYTTPFFFFFCFLLTGMQDEWERGWWNDTDWVLFVVMTLEIGVNDGTESLSCSRQRTRKRSREWRSWKERVCESEIASGVETQINERDDGQVSFPNVTWCSALWMASDLGEDQTIKPLQKPHSTNHSSRTAWDQRVQAYDVSWVSQRHVHG